ncbi:hypothetical protein [Leptospira santarosai]|uniref:hypothetical protein n=1 Tax=Leptospira santarosai TaxID=28183 RepID=UPI0024AF1229|nr:hypothetical protein [Leptospira santarosai]MDI7224670.1 hypothetical protein [Leptospira santarosai]
MAAFSPTKTRTWSKNTPADGDLIDDEIDRLYENDQYSKNRIDATDTNILNLLIPLGGVLEDNFDQLPNSNFKEINGQAISRTTYSTLWNLVRRNITGIVPATDRINSINHGCVEGQLIKFAFTGGGITALTNYYVRNPTSADFQISATATGTILDLTSSQTGEMVTNVEWGFGDGSTTFNVPCRNGLFVRNTGVHSSRAKMSGGNYDGGAVGFAGQDQIPPHAHQFYYNLNSNTSTNGGTATGIGAGPDSMSSSSTNGPNPGYSIRSVIADGSKGNPNTGNEAAPASVTTKCKVRVL